ncbi:hypothetical protein [Bacillus sp. FJAT-45350]|nr:hypothetical protein [Bacillus sp. FJAT-45350]
MKKILFSIVAGVLAITMLTACGEIQEEHVPDQEQIDRAAGNE